MSTSKKIETVITVFSISKRFRGDKEDTKKPQIESPEIKKCYLR